MSDFLDLGPIGPSEAAHPDWEREVPCYCGNRVVVTRRPPAFDKYVVCSRGCWDGMIRDGKHEPGSLIGEGRNA